ncbi:deoxynucleotidyltransferase terminal-interacting protein 1, partial [Notothenia coriiceps]|uniref:Deoxynucleotidyltransferase terminal-interacting protein 1 n=1 Tax=Notothenia coriiceps TaxID=8208 RepID=A0A6I9NRP9_9TELE
MGAQRSEGGREGLLLDGEQEEQRPAPWNLMIKHRQIQRRGRRSHMAVSYTDPQVSMDLLRAVLQPSFNDDIMAVFRKYHKFFDKAAQNVKENVSEEVQTDQLIREACRNALEHVSSLPVALITYEFTSCCFLLMLSRFLNTLISPPRLLSSTPILDTWSRPQE